MPSTGLLVPLPLQLLPLSELASLILRGLGSGRGIVMGAAISRGIRDMDRVEKEEEESSAADGCSEGESGYLSPSHAPRTTDRGVTRATLAIYGELIFSRDHNQSGVITIHEREFLD